MDAALLARLQFALTVGFHFIFPPLTIGLAWFIVGMLAWYRKTGDEAIRRIARFWVTLFGITFAVGVATGITMEFQFGTNWSQYSRFVGDIFGAPLAAEAVLAFFLESTFLGVLLFGWKRLSPTAHLVAGVMVAFGSTLSAFWIIVANSWMQTPAGYKLDPERHRAVLTDFGAAVFNPSTWPRFLHTVDGALITAAFFMLGVSAWFLLKNKQVAHAKVTLTMALWVGLAASVAQLGLGHWHAMQVAATQPLKLAAFESFYQDPDDRPGAPLLLFGIPDPKHDRVNMAVYLPQGLSILAFANPTAAVKGLNDFPRDEWPPIEMSFYPFHLMVILGMFFVAFTGLGVLLLRGGRVFTARWFLVPALLAIPLPFLTNELGWILAEVGRQPWIVYNVMKTGDAISVVVSATQILTTIVVFSIVYLLLFVLWIGALRHAMHAKADEVEPMPAAEAEGVTG